jgi:hypothetical protein
MLIDMVARKANELQVKASLISVIVPSNTSRIYMKFQILSKM